MLDQVLKGQNYIDSFEIEDMHNFAVECDRLGGTANCQAQYTGSDLPLAPKTIVSCDCTKEISYPPVPLGPKNFGPNKPKTVVLHNVWEVPHLSTWCKPGYTWDPTLKQCYFNGNKLRFPPKPPEKVLLFLE